MIAWVSLTPWAIHKIEALSYNYIKMNCTGGKCYGVLAVTYFPDKEAYFITKDLARRCIASALL